MTRRLGLLLGRVPGRSAAGPAVGAGCRTILLHFTHFPPSLRYFATLHTLRTLTLTLNLTLTLTLRPALLAPRPPPPHFHHAGAG